MSNIGTELNSFASNTFDFTNNLLANSSLIFIVAVIIILYIVLGGSSSSSNSYNNGSYNNNGTNVIDSGINVIGSIISIILLLIIFIIVIKLILGFDIIKYFYNFDIYAYLYNLFYPQPIVIPELPKMPLIHEIRKQVFNIPQNTYVYDDAKAVCSAYGARLATYKEVEDSYEGGGEWCNYGWSDGQMALFPTQQKTYDELQKKKGHENDCGRPGVNGGFIANPNLRFGVNCYGKKRKMTQEEEDLMATQPIYPRTVDELELEDRVKYWKDNLSTVFLSPFNHDTWSKF